MFTIIKTPAHNTKHIRIIDSLKLEREVLRGVHKHQPDISV